MRLEDEKREVRQQAKAEAARRLGGVYWLGTEQTLLVTQHYNFVLLHARRSNFPHFTEIEASVHEVWPCGEVASVRDIGTAVKENIIRGIPFRKQGDCYDRISDYSSAKELRGTVFL